MYRHAGFVYLIIRIDVSRNLIRPVTGFNYFVMIIDIESQVPLILRLSIKSEMFINFNAKSFRNVNK